MEEDYGDDPHEEEERYLIETSRVNIDQWDYPTHLNPEPESEDADGE